MCCLEPRFPGAREGNPSHPGAYRAEPQTKSVLAQLTVAPLSPPLFSLTSHNPRGPHCTLESRKGSLLPPHAHSPMLD